MRVSNFSVAAHLAKLADDLDGWASDYESEQCDDESEPEGFMGVDLGEAVGSGASNVFPWPNGQAIGPPFEPTHSAAALQTKAEAAQPFCAAPRGKSRVKKDNLNKRKKERRSAESAAKHPSFKAVSMKRIQEAAKSALEVKVSISQDLQTSITAPSWTVKRDGAHDTAEHDFAKLCGEAPGGFAMQHIPWNGEILVALVDSEGRIFCLLGAKPSDKDWTKDVATPAAEAIESTSKRMGFTSKSVAHRRGCFPSIAVGVSHGGGQTKPSTLRHSVKRTQAMKDLLEQKPFQRISGYADHLLHGYAPRLHHCFSSTNAALEKEDHQLVRPFPDTAFAACSVNFGPQTIAHKHRDYGNLAWGWCSITALGSFDAEAGGQLVLWDLNVAINFPPGSTILLPSALLWHSNASIAEHETRYSVTQYSAGALLRWVDNGFQSQEKWASQADNDGIQQREIDRRMRWQCGVGMLSLKSELQ